MDYDLVIVIIMVSICFIGFILLIIWAVNSDFSVERKHEQEIKNKIGSIGGLVMFVERSNGLIRLTTKTKTPFIGGGRGVSTYRFGYQINNQEIEGWVQFHIFYGAEWRLNSELDIENKFYEQEIKNKIGSIGGQIIFVERNDDLVYLGSYSKDRILNYKFFYQVNNQEKEGRVSFNTIYGVEWTL